MYPGDIENVVHRAASIFKNSFYFDWCVFHSKTHKTSQKEETYLDLRGWRAVEQSVVSEVLCKRCQEAAACLAACAWLGVAQPKTAKFLPDDFLVHLQVHQKIRGLSRGIVLVLQHKNLLCHNFGWTTLEDPLQRQLHSAARSLKLNENYKLKGNYTEQYLGQLRYTYPLLCHFWAVSLQQEKMHDYTQNIERPV